MKIKSIIVDDNPLNIEVLSDLLKEGYKQIQLAGTAANGKEALDLISSEKPDLVFLDVEMPDMNGFEVLAALKEISFKTIFVTAHSHYAIQAIRFNALDYLVKPIKQMELDEAIKRFLSNRKEEFQEQIEVALSNLNKKEVKDQVLYLPTQEGGLRMTLRNIILIQGDRNYSTFHLVNNKTKISSKTLGHFGEILKDKGFFRCHRSYIVNRCHISHKSREGFILTTGDNIPISRRRKKEANAWFGTL